MMGPDLGNLGLQSGIGLQGGIKIPNMPTAPAKINNAIQGQDSSSPAPASRTNTPTVTADTLPMQDANSANTTQGPMQGSAASPTEPYNVDFDTMMQRKLADLKNKTPSSTQLDQSKPFDISSLQPAPLPVTANTGNTSNMLDTNSLNPGATSGGGTTAGSINNTGFQPSDNTQPKKYSDYTEQGFNQLPKDQQAQLSIQDKTTNLVNQLRQQFPQDTAKLSDQEVFQAYYKNNPDQIKQALQPDIEKGLLKIDTSPDGQMILSQDTSKQIKNTAFDIPAPIKELGNTLYDIAKNEGGVISDAYNGKISAGEAALRTGSNGLDAIMAPVSAGISSISHLIPTDNGPSGVHDFLQNTAVGQRIGDVITSYQDIASKHPEAAKDVSAIANIALNTLGMGAEGKIADSAVGDTLKTVGNAVGDTKAGKVLGGALDSVAGQETPGLSDNVKKILSEPTTNDTVKEAIVNPSKGELQYDPREGFSKWLLGDQKATLGASDKAQIAQDIVYDKLGDTASANHQQLYQQIKGVIKDVSENEIKPSLTMLRTSSFPTEMTQAQTEFANKIYPDLSTQELRPSEVSSIKKAISDLDNAKNGNDIWDIAKNFDNSFPQSIKNNPNTMSYGVWRDGRGILNDLLENMAIKADVPSIKKAFSDISALKIAQQNILDNVGSAVKGSKGALNPGNVIKAGLAGAGLHGFIGVIP